MLSKFMDGVRSMRIYLIDIVRKNASKIFSIRPAIAAECYSKLYDRSQVPTLVDLLRSPKYPDEQYAMYPRVLFTNYEVNNVELFGSIAISNVSSVHPSPPPIPHGIRQILKAILRGPSAVGSRSTLTQRSGPKGNAHSWELKSITPGCIAMAATVVSCLLPQLPPHLPPPSRLNSSSHQTRHFRRRVRYPRSTTAIVSNITKGFSLRPSALHGLSYWWHDSRRSSSKSTRWMVRQLPRPRGSRM